MVKVLIAEPAMAGMVGRFAERLPPGTDVVAVSSFDDGEFRRLARDATVLVNARRPIDASTLAMAPELRFVQLIGAGFDTIDRAAVADAGIAVAYNPGVNKVGAAEHTVMLMLALIKRLPISEERTRAGAFVPGEVIAAGIDDLADATVGLVGMGQIGRAVAERLVAFGPRIVYHTRRPVVEVEEQLGARHVALGELLASSTIVSLHVPLTRDTHHLIGGLSWQPCHVAPTWSTPDAAAWSTRPPSARPSSAGISRAPGSTCSSTRRMVETRSPACPG